METTDGDDYQMVHTGLMALYVQGLFQDFSRDFNNIQRARFHRHNTIFFSQSLQKKQYLEVQNVVHQRRALYSFKTITTRPKLNKFHTSNYISIVVCLLRGAQHNTPGIKPH